MPYFGQKRLKNNSLWATRTYIVYISLYNHFSVLLFLQGCSTILNETFGQIELTTSSIFTIQCKWIIQSAGIREAVAFIAVQELNRYFCRYSEALVTKGGVACNGLGMPVFGACFAAYTVNLYKFY